MIDIFSSQDALALLLASIIFSVTVLLLITRVIGFWITMLLLLFTLATGVVVGNFGAIGDYLRSARESEPLKSHAEVPPAQEQKSETPDHDTKQIGLAPLDNI